MNRNTIYLRFSRRKMRVFVRAFGRHVEAQHNNICSSISSFNNNIIYVVSKIKTIAGAGLFVAIIAALLTFAGIGANLYISFRGLSDYARNETLMDGCNISMGVGKLISAKCESGYWVHEAEKWERGEKWEEAIKDLDLAIILDKNNAKYFAHKAVDEYKSNNIEEAINCYDVAINLEPKDGNLYLLRGNMRYEQTKNSQKSDSSYAISDWSAAIKLTNNYAEAYQARAEAFFQKKQYKNAADDFRSASNYFVDKKKKSDNLYKRGLSDEKIGDIKDAESALGDAAGGEPENLEFKEALCEFYNSVETYKKERDCWNDIIKSHPNDIEALLHRGKLYEIYGESDLDLARSDAFDLAESDFKQANQVNKINPDALVELGKLATRFNKIEKARSYLKEAIKVNQNNAEILEALAEVEDASGNYGEAVNLFDNALQNVNSAEDISRLSDKKAFALIESGDPAQAKKVADSVMAYENRNDILGGLARAGASMALWDIKSAAEEVEEVEKHDPNNIIALGLKCMIETQLHGKISDACEKMSVLETDTARTYAVRCAAYSSLRDYLSALSECNKGVKAYPDDIELHALRSFIFLSFMDADKALADLAIAEKTNNKIEFMLDKIIQAFIYAALKDDPCRAFEMLRDITNDKVLGWLALTLRSVVYAVNGGDEEALDDLNDAIARMPNGEFFDHLRWSLIYRRGVIYVEQKKYGEGVDEFKSIVEKNSNDENLLLSVCVVDYLAKRYNDTIDDCTKVIEKKSDSARAYETRGYAFADLEREEDSNDDLDVRDNIYASGTYNNKSEQVEGVDIRIDRW